jgi:hypothetical protein
MELITLMLYSLQMDTTIEFRCKVLLGIIMDQLSRRELEHFHCTIDREKQRNKEHKVTFTLSNGLLKGQSSYFVFKRNDRIVAYSDKSDTRSLRSFANIIYTAFDFNSHEGQQDVAFHMISQAIETLNHAPTPTKVQISHAKSPVCL